MKNFILLLAASTLLISCATGREQATMDSWLKRSKAELIREWGPPTSSSSYGHGIEVLSYKRKRTCPIAASGKPSTQVMGKFDQFYISSDGAILLVTTKNPNNLI